MEEEDVEWLVEYYRGLGYNERRIAQMLKEGKIQNKKKQVEVRRMMRK